MRDVLSNALSCHSMPYLALEPHVDTAGALELAVPYAPSQNIALTMARFDSSPGYTFLQVFA